MIPRRIGLLLPEMGEGFGGVPIVPTPFYGYFPPMVRVEKDNRIFVEKDNRIEVSK